MDEEMESMEDLVIDEDSFSEIFDPVYEFDACQFFDLSRGETEFEADEAERWFQYAHEYPISPFIVKLKLMKASKGIPKKIHKTSSGKIRADQNASTSSSISDGDIDNEVTSKEVKIKGVKHHNNIAQDIAKAKSKPAVGSKPNCSTFMKPTASHLAKQNKECDVHSGGCGRLQKPLVKGDERLRSPSGGEILATKRQKLEIGYLRKVAQLKHRSSLLHKIAKKVAQMEVSSYSRSKTTIPRKPALVTEERSQRQRSQSKCESGQPPKANTNALKARPLNRKILDSPKLPQNKKSMNHLTEVREFPLKTTQRAKQHQSTTNRLYKQKSVPVLRSEDIPGKRQDSINAGKNNKLKSPNKSKSCTTDKLHPIKDGGIISNTKHDLRLPPIELFKKLSLKSESDTKIISTLKPPRVTKVLKENVPRSFQQDFKRCAGKPNQCGNDRRIPEVKTQPNINRSVDFRCDYNNKIKVV